MYGLIADGVLSNTYWPDGSYFVFEAPVGIVAGYPPPGEIDQSIHF